MIQKLKVGLKVLIYLIKKEIEKATKNINNEMHEYAEDFYDDKKDKEKGDGFEL